MNFNYKTLAIAGGLLYAAHKGYVKNKTANTAMVALGAVLAVRQVPVINTFVNV